MSDFPICFVFSTNRKILSQHCLAPITNNGTPIKSIFNPLEKNPPIDITIGTVGDVLENIIFS